MEYIFSMARILVLSTNYIFWLETHHVLIMNFLNFSKNTTSSRSMDIMTIIILRNLLFITKINWLTPNLKV